MSRGQKWIGEIMEPLRGHLSGPEEWNPIYEAVGRGSERQGKRLVSAIVSIVNRVKGEPAEAEAYSPESFADAHSISRAFLYKLWAQGKGPQRVKVGRRTMITREAAAAWRRWLLEERGVDVECSPRTLEGR